MVGNCRSQREISGPLPFGYVGPVLKYLPLLGIHYRLEQVIAQPAPEMIVLPGRLERLCQCGGQLDDARILRVKISEYLVELLFCNTGKILNPYP